MKILNNKQDNRKNISSKISLIVSLGLFIFLTMSLVGRISKLKKANLSINKTKEKITKLEKEKNKLEKDLEIVKSEEYIEKQLRDNLGMAKDGDIVIILPDKEEVRKFAPRMDEEEELLPDPSWKKWMRLFGF